MWKSTDLNIAVFITIGELAGVTDWSVISPASSPKILATTLAVLLADAEKVDIDTAQLAVLSMGVDELTECLELN